MNLKDSRTTIEKYKMRVKWIYYLGNLLKICDKIGLKLENVNKLIGSQCLVAFL